MKEKWREMYKNKLASPQDCANYLKDGDAVVVPLANGVPVAICDAIAQRIRQGTLKNILYLGGVDLKWTDLFSKDIQDQVTIETGFAGAATRPGVQQGIFTYMPVRLGQFIDIIGKYKPGIPRGAVALVVSPMDDNGYFSCGVNVDIGWGSAKTGVFRHIFLEINENMPRTFGNNHIHITEVTAVVENTTPLVELPPRPLTEEDKKIGEYIADLVPDGACIQLGIGSIPNAVANSLKDKKDLGVHSEMLTDSMVDLFYEGVITGARKQIDRFKMVGCFALGTKKLYDFVHENPAVAMYCTSYVNNPSIIGMNDNVISVNATLEVDITGQAASESIGYRQYSGTGGQLDFIQGAWISKGGKSFLALHSTHTDKNGEKHSTIVPMLSPGMYVTTSRTEVDNIVTEYGVAPLKGWDIRTRVKNLINIAHPDFRDWLTFEARKMNLIP